MLFTSALAIYESQITSAFQFLIFLYVFSPRRETLIDLPWTSMYALHVASPLGVEAMQVYRPVSPSWVGKEKKNKYLKQSGTQWARKVITTLYVPSWIWINVLGCKNFESETSSIRSYDFVCCKMKMDTYFWAFAKELEKLQILI